MSKSPVDSPTYIRYIMGSQAKTGEHMSDQPQKLLLDTKEAARRMRISYSQLSRMRLEGKGPPSIKFGKVYRYRPEAIEAWLTEQENAQSRS